MAFKFQQTLLAFLLAIGTYLVFKIVKFLYGEWTSPLRVLPGPSNPSLLFGNMKQIWDSESLSLHEKWIEEYGSTIRYRVFFGLSRLYTTDLKAVNHLLMNTSIYQKPEQLRRNMSNIVGNGVLVVEGEKHKQQRRIMNPAFGTAQIRELTEIFIDKSIELRDVWALESMKPEKNGRIDVLSWLSRTTLDVIGLAGFNYNFGALSSDPNTNELNNAFQVIFHTGMSMNFVNMLRMVFPIFRFLPTERDIKTRKARETMLRIGGKLLKDSHTAVRAENEVVEKSSWKRKDLLSLLVRANMAGDLPPNQRMSDEDVLAQVPTFLVAGHETTSTATAWALYALTQAPEVQMKLRDELLSVSTDNPTMDDLNNLPYLDAVVRETLRVHSPVPSTMRVATKDDILPLGTPIRTKNGELINSILVKKGQTIFVPILTLHRDRALWGEDALEFKPDRWLGSKTPEAVASIPGVWSNMLTFLGGPRACIGYRFTLVEMKALLFTVVRAFEFELAVPPEDIIKKVMIVQRPVVTSEKEKGNQMPLRLKPFQRV